MDDLSFFFPSTGIFCVLLNSLTQSSFAVMLHFSFHIKLILGMFFFKALTALKARKENLKLNHVLAALHWDRQLAHSITSANIMYLKVVFTYCSGGETNTKLTCPPHFYTWCLYDHCLICRRCQNFYSSCVD